MYKDIANFSGKHLTIQIRKIAEKKKNSIFLNKVYAQFSYIKNLYMLLYFCCEYFITFN